MKKKTFKEKVQSMTGKEIVMAMVKGLQKPVTKIDMNTFGGTRQEICYGCAATNAICKIAKMKFQPKDLQYGIFGRVEAISKKFSEVPNSDSRNFLTSFEMAINYLRGGHIHAYNIYARRCGFAILTPPLDILPTLESHNYKEGLQKYIDYANTLE